MATWEDGPEYAPVARPSEYADAGAPPLEQAPPVVDLAAGAPLEHPRFADPSAPVAPLETLIPPVEDPRNPQLPFEVASSTLTEQSSAWSAAHLRAPASAPSASEPYAAPGPSVSQGWPAPAQAPLPPPQGPAQPYGNYAAPGTTQWFAPPPPGAVPVSPTGLTAATLFNAASPGALICLLVGGLVYPLGPVTLLVALGLSTRGTVARRQVKIAYGISLGLLGVVGVLSLLLGRYDFAEWWLVISRWGQALSFALIVATLVLVGLGLKGRFDPQPRPWG